MGKRGRKTVYSDEFKQSAVSMKQLGMRVKDIAKELGVHQSMISRWTKGV